MRIGAGLALAVVIGQMLPVKGLADDEPQTESVQSAPLKGTARSIEEAQDGFVPLKKLVPRAKIALRPNERLPTRDGEKTFASYGARDSSYLGHIGQPPVPMYFAAYHPLYFEDPNLERNGLSCGCCLQPLVSGAHFFGSVAFLPVKIAYAPPCSYVFPPAECPPGTRFGDCKSFLGQEPDLPSRLGFGTFYRREVFR
jgi:hypothetical protein